MIKKGIIAAATTVVGAVAGGILTAVMVKNNKDELKKQVLFEEEITKFIANYKNTNLQYNNFEFVEKSTTNNELQKYTDSIEVTLNKFEAKNLKDIFFEDGSRIGGGSIRNINNFFNTKTPYVEMLKNACKKENININNILYSLSNSNENIIEVSKKIESNKSGLRKGKLGEERILAELKRLNYPCEILINKTFFIGGDAFEVDFIIVIGESVFLLEVKNIGENTDSSIDITADGQFIKRIGNNIYKANKSPISQLSDHANKIKSIDPENKMKLIPLLVIANEDVKIDNKSTVKVIRGSYLQQEILDEVNGKKINKDVATDICSSINEYQCGEKRFKAEFLDGDLEGNIKQNLAVIDFIDKLNELIIKYE